MSLKNGLNTNKLKKIILITVIIILILILAFVAFLKIMTNSSKPSGKFEGTWEGGLVIKELDNDATGYYKDFDKPLEVIIDIDEQSAAYGHIRIRTKEAEVIDDMVFPCIFKDGVLLVEDEELVLSAKTLVDHGTAYMDAEFLVKKLKSGIVIKGIISSQKIFGKPNVFEYTEDRE